MTNTAEIIKFEERQVVKADTSNGFDMIAHEISNALIQNRAKLSGCEIQILFMVVSKTYRFHKKSDWIANVQFCEETGLGKGHVSNLITSLINKKVLFKDGRRIGINTIVSEWEVHKSVNKSSQISESNSSQIREQEFTNSCKQVHKSVNKSSQIRETQKKETNTKEITTKEISVKRSKQIPKDFKVTDSMRAWAIEKGVTANIQFETEQFIDYHGARGNTMKDWGKAWQTWMRNTVKFNKGTRQSQPKPEAFAKKDYGHSRVSFEV